MKYAFILLATITIGFSCKKDESIKPMPDSYYHLADTDERIGQTLRFICVGGDTVFSDTLILTLQSISLSISKTEMFCYGFNYPVWSHKNLIISTEDAAQLKTLNFTNEDCKSAYFKLTK
jgi:hypothetical protein